MKCAIAQLDLRASDRVLEIGCESGQAVALVASRASITAIDRSATQVQRARANNPGARIETLSLEDAPDALGETFDKIFAINVNVFWTSPVRALKSVRRLLAPRGTLFLIYEPPSAGQARKIEEMLKIAFEENAFALEAIRHEGRCVVAIARFTSG